MGGQWIGTSFSIVEKKKFLKGVAGFGFWWHGERGGFVSVIELIKN
jgi:hypothetical protein